LRSPCLKTFFGFACLSVFLVSSQGAYAGVTVATTITKVPANGSTPAYEVTGFCQFKQPPAFTTKASCGGAEVPICTASVTCTNVSMQSTDGKAFPNGSQTMDVADSVDMIANCNAKSCDHGVATADTGYDAGSCITDPDFKQDSAVKQVGDAAGKALKSNSAN